MSLTKKSVLGLLVTIMLLIVPMQVKAASNEPPPPNDTQISNIQQSTVLYLFLLGLPDNTDSLSVSCEKPLGKTATFGLIPKDGWLKNAEKVYNFCGKSFSGPYTIYITFK